MNTISRPTLRDVAKIAAVSANTVSRALKDKPDIGTKTKQRIREIVRELGYVPCATARSLKLQRSYTIGVMATELDNPVRSAFIEYLRTIADKAGYQILVVGLSPDGSCKSDGLLRLLSYNVEGIIIGNIAGKLADLPLWPQIKIALRRNIPIVSFGALNYDNISSVSIDYFHQSCMLVDHLYEQGCRNITFTGFCEHATRFAGYLHAMRQHNLAPKTFPLEKIDLSLGKSCIKKYLDENPLPDAFIARNDLHAIWMIAGLRELGISVPKDVAIAGFDNLDIDEHMNPSLTSVGVDYHAIARKLLEMIEENINATGEKTILAAESPGTLYPRESTLRQLDK
jgi:DNA-binding LacI/PurR family transcriptional regulator